jgi:hypothetical protein
MAGPGEVLVSGTVKDLVVGSGLAFTDRGGTYDENTVSISRRSLPSKGDERSRRFPAT